MHVGDFLLHLGVQHDDGHAQLPLDALTHLLHPLPQLAVLVDQHDLGVAELQAVNKRIPAQVVVDHCRRGPDCPGRQPADGEFGAVGEVKGDHLIRRDAEVEQERGVVGRQGVCFSPGVAAGA